MPCPGSRSTTTAASSGTARAASSASRASRSPGLYCAGWIKRGPSGVIGTNKKDAAETAANLLADRDAGLLPRGEGDLEEFLSDRGLSFVDYAGWEAIDAEESARGAPHGRPRVKLASWEELLGRARKRVAPVPRARAPDRAALAGPRACLRGPRLESFRCRNRSGDPETAKAIENFPVSGQPIPSAVVRWLGRIKAAAARVNAELGLLEPDKAARIAAAADRIVRGELDDQFPVDVFQTGSGTSSNTNANEVIAALAGADVHPNDDVNLGQSSNDVFPSAVHLAALAEIVGDLLPALDRLTAGLQAKAEEFDAVVKSGRTHWMDAVPVTLGQEFGGYATQVREGAARVRGTLERLGKIPLGGTAVGTGLNTHPEFAARVRARLAAETGLAINPPADPFESQAARDGLVEASGALKTVAVSLTKIANDLRFLASGPRTGLAEIALPELQKGSSIMPGKVNPVIPEVVTQVAAQVIGNDAAITIGGMQGHFELNVFVPMLARNLDDSIRLLTSAARLLADKCVSGIEANREQCERYAELTLSAATALNPHIGYDRAAEIVKEAARSGRPLRDVAREAGVPEAVLDEALDLRAMAKPAG